MKQLFVPVILASLLAALHPAAQAADAAKPGQSKASEIVTNSANAVGRVTKKVGDAIDKGVDAGLSGANRGGEAASSAIARTAKKAGLPGTDAQPAAAPAKPASAPAKKAKKKAKKAAKPASAASQAKG